MATPRGGYRYHFHQINELTESNTTDLGPLASLPFQANPNHVEIHFEVARRGSLREIFLGCPQGSREERHPGVPGLPDSP